MLDCSRLWLTRITAAGMSSLPFWSYWQKRLGLAGWLSKTGLCTLEFLLRLLPQIFGTPGIGCTGSEGFLETPCDPSSLVQGNPMRSFLSGTMCTKLQKLKEGRRRAAALVKAWVDLKLGRACG